MFPQIRPRALFLICLIILVYPLFSGCTSILSDCGGNYSSTRIQASSSIQYALNRSDPHFNNWTKAAISTRFTIDTSDLNYFNYTYGAQVPGQNQYKAIIYFNQTGGFVRYNNEKFSMKDWTKFTIETKVISNDPVLNGYTFFNGTSKMTGKLKIMDTGTSGNHHMDTVIDLDQDYPGVNVQSPPGTYNKEEINLKTVEWTFTLISFSNVGIKC